MTTKEKELYTYVLECEKLEDMLWRAIVTITATNHQDKLDEDILEWFDQQQFTMETEDNE